MKNIELVRIALAYLAAYIEEAEDYLDIKIDPEQLTMLETLFSEIDEEP